MEAGLKKAISVPMSLAKAVCKLWEPLRELATIGNFGTKSDLQVFLIWNSLLCKTANSSPTYRKQTLYFNIYVNVLFSLILQ